MMDEQQEARYRELKLRIAEVDSVISEGQACLAFQSSAFYPIAKRVYDAEVHTYKEECFKAAKSRLSNISNFLGRMEGVEDFWDILCTRFIVSMKQAEKKRLSLEAELKEFMGEVNSPVVGSQDDPAAFS